MATAWVAGTTIGGLGAGVIEDPARLGLDAAFPAGFVALLAPRLREDRRARAVTLLGAAVALVLVPFAPVGIPSVVASSAALLALTR